MRLGNHALLALSPDCRPVAQAKNGVSHASRTPFPACTYPPDNATLRAFGIQRYTARTALGRRSMWVLLVKPWFALAYQKGTDGMNVPRRICFDFLLTFSMPM